MFKKYMKKAIALVLATSMLAVCGCGQQAEKPSEKESTPVTSESKSEEKTSESKASEAVEEERVTLTVFATASTPLTNFTLDSSPKVSSFICSPLYF